MKIKVRLARSATLAEFCDQHDGRATLTERLDTTWAAEFLATVSVGPPTPVEFHILEEGDTARAAIRKACRVLSGAARHWPDPKSASGWKTWHAPRISGVYAPDDWDTFEYEQGGSS